LELCRESADRKRKRDPTLRQKPGERVGYPPSPKAGERVGQPTRRTIEELQKRGLIGVAKSGGVVKPTVWRVGGKTPKSSFHLI